jgi:hypothetical protein
MQDPGWYEKYPIRVIFISNLLSLMMYGIGAYVLYRFGLIWVILYIIFILAIEYRLMSGHCVDCYYYGKRCAFGKGWLSSRLFPKGNPEQFCKKTITWKDIIPDFLLFFIPVSAGIVLLIMEFSWTILILLIVLLVLGFFGSALVRGQLACRYCKQRETGCPAEQLFDKKRD